MHKVYENDDLMMYLKKRYCHCCGGALHRKRTERIVKKGDLDHGAYCTIGTNYKPYGDILVVGKEYYCSSCDKVFSCDEQGKIIEAQKHYGRKIVSKEEVSFVHDNNLIFSANKIMKLKWSLLMPIIGGLICMFFIFNGRLSEKTNTRDGIKLIFSSIIVLVGVALVIKIVLSMFASVDFINRYETMIMLIPSILSFNLPILWYINRKFK